jgi:hypothetical protein
MADKIRDLTPAERRPIEHLLGRLTFVQQRAADVGALLDQLQAERRSIEQDLQLVAGVLVENDQRIDLATMEVHATPDPVEDAAQKAAALIDESGGE